MSLKLDLTKIKTEPPTGSGVTICEHCGGKAWTEVRKWQGEPYHIRSFCLQGWNPKEPEKSTPCKGQKTVVVS